MKATPTVPAAVSDEVIAGAGGLTTVNVSVAVPVPLTLVAPMVMAETPVAFGVPVMAPLLVFTDSPDGNPVALKLVGLLLAVI